MEIPPKVVIVILVITVVIAAIVVALSLREPKLSKEEVQQMIQEGEASAEMSFMMGPHPEYIDDLTQITEIISKAKNLDEISLNVDKAKKLLPLLKEIQQTKATDNWKDWRTKLDDIKAVWGEQLTTVLEKHPETEIESFSGEIEKGNPFATGKRKEALENAIKLITEKIK